MQHSTVMMKSQMKALIAAGALLVSIGCSDLAQDPLSSVQNDGVVSLSRVAAVKEYVNKESGIRCTFNLPDNKWVMSSHGVKNINGNKIDSDVLVYSPSENYIPRFTIIAFTREKPYPNKRLEKIAERKTTWREKTIKELYPDRFVGRVDLDLERIGGVKAPKIVYDMQDAEKTKVYRSTEYTFVRGRTTVTVQFTNDFNRPETDRILKSIYQSFRVERL